MMSRENASPIGLVSQIMSRRTAARQLQPLKSGAQGWNRTSDTRIFSPLLYQLSYLGLRAGEFAGPLA